MISPKLTIRFEGPFFVRDVRKTMRDNIRDMLADLAENAAADVRDHSPSLTDAFRTGVVGRVASLSGRPWALHAVISQQHVYPWPGGGSRQYRGGKLEKRRHMFAQTARRVRLRKADLTRGLQ